MTPIIFQLLPRLSKNGYLANENRKNCWQAFDIWGCVATFDRNIEQNRFFKMKMLARILFQKNLPTSIKLST
jgi:hypothetical protein